MTLILGGWVANSRVGPGRIDWETVALPGARTVQLARPDGTLQRWWVVERDSTIVANVIGTAARIETRLLVQGEPRHVQPHFVVGIAVDGVDREWRTHEAKRDTTARLEGYVVGDRDRVEVVLPGGGTHRLAVRLVAAAEGQLLVRVRQADEAPDD